MKLDNVAKILQEKNNIEILTHHYPDGDTLGSAYGLCKALQDIGKNARVILSGKAATKFDYLKNGVKENSFTPDFIMSVDVAAPQLLGDNEESYSNKIQLCIDHHGSNSLQAGQKLLDAQLLCGDAVHRAEQAVQHMVQAMVFPGALKCLNIAGRFHHADDRGIPLCAGTDGAKLCLRIVLADAAAMKLGVSTLDCACQSCSVFIRHAQYLICHTGSTLAPDARKFAELFDQLFQRGCSIAHVPLCRVWQA